MRNALFCLSLSQNLGTGLLDILWPHYHSYLVILSFLLVHHGDSTTSLDFKRSMSISRVLCTEDWQLLETLFCASTYQKILEIIAKPALETGRVKLSTRVSRIDTGNDTVTVYTEDGQELQYDEVVMTAPLGWLKLNKGTFVPPLPPRFTQAIDAIGYGCLEKVRSSVQRSDILERYIV